MALGDKLEEEEIFEAEEIHKEKMVKLMDNIDKFLEISNALKMECKGFWVIGINSKKRIFAKKWVQNINQAYIFINQKKLTLYLFADHIWNTEEERVNGL